MVRKTKKAKKQKKQEPIALKTGEDIKTYVNAFYEQDKSVQMQAYRDNEVWKTQVFHIRLEDTRDSHTDEDIIDCVVPGSQLTLAQFKILYALQFSLDIRYFNEKNCQEFSDPLMEQVQSWFTDAEDNDAGYMLQEWPELCNITYRADDKSFNSLVSHRNSKAQPLTPYISCFLTIRH